MLYVLKLMLNVVCIVHQQQQQRQFINVKAFFLISLHLLPKPLTASALCRRSMDVIYMYVICQRQVLKEHASIQQPPPCATLML